MAKAKVSTHTTPSAKANGNKKIQQPPRSPSNSQNGRTASQQYKIQLWSLGVVNLRSLLPSALADGLKSKVSTALATMHLWLEPESQRIQHRQLKQTAIRKYNGHLLARASARVLPAERP